MPKSKPKAGRKSCSKKHHYRTRLDALIALSEVHAKGHDGIEAYRCRDCGGWCLGRSNRLRPSY